MLVSAGEVFQWGTNEGSPLPPPQTAPARPDGQIPNQATEFGLWGFRSSGKEAAQGQDPSKNEALMADGFSSTQARQAS